MLQNVLTFESMVCMFVCDIAQTVTWCEDTNFMSLVAIHLASKFRLVRIVVIFHSIIGNQKAAALSPAYTPAPARSISLSQIPFPTQPHSSSSPTSFHPTSPTQDHPPSLSST